MSRIGKKPIALPGPVKTSIIDNVVKFEGPKGSLTSPIPEGISAEINDGELVFERKGDDGPSRAKHGLARALANNCVLGVTEGFKKQLSILGVGYRVNVSGQKIEMHLGYSHPINVELPSGVAASVENDKATKAIILTLEGIDKQQIGQIAANIRKLRKPEPYKGKGIRYRDEVILRKAGKAGK